jgi:hypothetical protein
MIADIIRQELSFGRGQPDALRNGLWRPSTLVAMWRDLMLLSTVKNERPFAFQVT